LDYSHQTGFGSVPSCDAWLKGPVEQIIASMVIVLMIVPIILTALVTRLALGPPILFRQIRVGKNMQPFTLHKFRTMHDTRDPAGNLLPDQARETAISRFMRRIRVDEFPQLFTIASGRMSFIGPRPLLPATIQVMGDFGKLRCRVRPGLSGWAQVNGATRLSDAQKLALDIWYVDHRCLRLDLLILLKTAATLVRGERINQRHLTEAENYVAARYCAPMPAKSGQLR
jgi:lipopolysaccharide/colanic/teichoic acid biosynthesis glycosyltransferase